MTLVHAETGELIERLSEAEAERLTTRISLKLDAMADTYVGVMPLIREAITREAYASLGYLSVGAYISDRFGGSLAKLGMDVRREVVHELSNAGMSTRAIAPVVGVSKDTVHRDLSGVSRETPAPQSPAVTSTPTAGTSPEAAEEGEAEAVSGSPSPEVGSVAPSTPPARPPVTGLDGKTYTRPAPKPVVDDAEWDAQDRAEELARNLSRNLSLLYAVTDDERRREYIDNWRKGVAQTRPLGADFITPTHMRALAEALQTFADEWEQSDV